MAVGKEASVIWRFSDAKPGHDNQTLGLVEALSQLLPVESHILAPLPMAVGLKSLLAGQYPVAHLPDPDLIIGAGHRTHLSMLAARRARGGRNIVLMRPSMPLRWFDLCLIPEHDNPPNKKNVLATRGVLNRIHPAKDQDSGRGLFLIGGPSAHYDWDNVAIWRQIAIILEADPAVDWTLTTSRRTPPEFLKSSAVARAANLTVIPFTDTGPGWLPEKLAYAAQVWVSADSVSMVFEALTAGAAVGILDVPQRHRSRVSGGLERLMAEGWVQPFHNWRQNRTLPRPAGSFNEATRCAHWIVQHWFN